VKSNKPYKSLKDVYSENVNGHVAPRRHLRVLGEAQIILSYDERNVPQEVIKVSDEDLTKVSNYFSGRAEMSYMDNKDAEAITKLAEDSGFSDQTRWLKGIFKDYDNRINYESFRKYVGDKPGLKVLRSKLADDMGDGNLYDICRHSLEEILENPEDAREFYDTLFVHTFEQGQVNVGAGELALSLLTEAKKGQIGDLDVPGVGQVEVKVGKGRVISARQSGFRTDRDLINKIAEGHFDEVPEKLAKIKWNNKLADAALTNDNLKQYIINNKLDAAKRKDRIGALLLHAYGRKGNAEFPDEEGQKFDVLLAVFQKGYGATTKDKKPVPGTEGRRWTGTWEYFKYVKVKDLETVIEAVEKGFLSFGFNPDGVYIFYPGSNVTGAGAMKERVKEAGAKRGDQAGSWSGPPEELGPGEELPPSPDDDYRSYDQQ